MTGPRISRCSFRKIDKCSRGVFQVYRHLELVGGRIIYYWMTHLKHSRTAVLKMCYTCPELTDNTYTRLVGSRCLSYV